MPTCWIIAGPNGAGKTTFALEFLPRIADCNEYINADLIAAGLSPLMPEREIMAASRIYLVELSAHISKRVNFAFESTLSGLSYLRSVKRLKAEGWNVELIYLALPSVEMSKQRVAERVAHGGHNISLQDIERRFPRSLYNLIHLFSPVVDHCLCFMNHGEYPELVFEQQGSKRELIHSAYYEILINESHK